MEAIKHPRCKMARTETGKMLLAIDVVGRPDGEIYDMSCASDKTARMLHESRELRHAC